VYKSSNNDNYGGCYFQSELVYMYVYCMMHIYHILLLYFVFYLLLFAQFICTVQVCQNCAILSSAQPNVFSIYSLPWYLPGHVLE